MAAYIHNNLIGQISQITIQPVGNDTNNTELFEISASGDELFLPIVKSNNIVVNNTVAVNSTTIAESSTTSVTGATSATSGSGY